jgi:predicted 3-demethylubiquinone-9 3-methyltransferase (glyoxalase superfamily)
VYYGKDENEKEGAIKHATILLGNTYLSVLDSGISHRFTFTPAVSFMIQCRDQAEIDHFWNALSFVPEAEQCGWVADRYGISWQVVPTLLSEMLSDSNPERRSLVTKALLSMKKIDVAALKKAYHTV